jgi:molybdopterin-guanine dinucleotide biosynthesis protein B
MIPIISIVGKSDAGKTTLIEKLIPELRKRGYRVATVKHDVHGFNIDIEGKDSWRHKEAGADTVIISSPAKVGIVKDVERDLRLDELSGRYIQNVDIIISEGYKSDKHPKIEISRKVVSESLLSNPENGLIAVVSDNRFDLDLPVFDLDEIKELVDFIEDRFLKREVTGDVLLRVNGQPIPLTPFVKSVLKGVISGILSSLKGCNDIDNVEIKIVYSDKNKIVNTKL